MKTDILPSPRWRALAALLDRIADANAFVTLRDVSAISVGVFGSVYSPEIRDTFLRSFITFQPSWPPVVVHDVAPIPTAFWLGVIAVGMMHHHRQRFIARQHRDEQKALTSGTDRLITQTEAIETQTDRLEEILRTLPRDDFLDQFKAIHPAAHVDFVRAITSPRLDAEHIARAVRTLLKGVLLLVESFDPADEGVRYGANLMLYAPAEGLDDEAFGALLALNPYASLGIDRRDVAGLLVLHRGLSTVLTIGDGSWEAAPDALLRPMVLPIPRRVKSAYAHDRYRVLPGAPLAFCTGDLVGYADTGTLAGWCEAEGVFTPDQVHEVRAYFEPRDGQHIRSLLSVPLPPSDGQTGGARIGVVNVHRDQRGMLQDRSPATHLVPLLQPVLMMLRDLCHAYRLATANERLDSEVNKGELFERPRRGERPMNMPEFFQSDAYPQSHAAETFARLQSGEWRAPKQVYVRRGDMFIVRTVEREPRKRQGTR